MTEKVNYRKSTYILVIVLFILVLSRIAIYFILGAGFVDSDAKSRYLPQVEELSQSLYNLFSQIGPAYSLFLLFFKKMTADMVVSSILAQHIIGVITGIMVFYYFRKVNLFLAAFVTVFVYAGWLALWLEHTILRDSLTAFFLVLQVVIFTLVLKQDKYYKFPYAFLAGFISVVLVLLRIELIVLVMFFPLVLFFAKIGKPSHIRLKSKKIVLWFISYFVPLLIVFLIFSANINNQQHKKIHYGSLFDVSYYSMAYNGFFPQIFYYESSRYPELMEKYQSTFKIHEEELNKLAAVGKREKTGRSINIFVKATEDYLSEHPEINLSVSQLMDKVYPEIMQKNTLVFLQGVAVNFKEHLTGLSEMHSVLAKSGKLELLKIHLSGKDPRGIKPVKPVSLFDMALVFYFKSMIVFGKVLFWLSIITLPIMIWKWKKLPLEVTVSAFVAILHIGVLSVVADPSHRFRYSIDPFIYFLQLYMITYLIKTILPGCVKLGETFHNDRNK